MLHTDPHEKGFLDQKGLEVMSLPFFLLVSLILSLCSFPPLFSSSFFLFGGLQTVRRDNCALTRMVLQKCLEFILVEKNVEGAKEFDLSYFLLFLAFLSPSLSIEPSFLPLRCRFVKRTIADLLQDRVDTSLLVITKQYSKIDYKAKVAHVELAKRMLKRDPGSVFPLRFPALC